MQSIIKQTVEQERLSDIIFVGPVSRPLDYLCSADVFLLPSIIEGMPAVVLEAMYCRTPVVAYDVGGISEVIRNGETGWLTRAGDEGAFANAVMEVLETPDIESIRQSAFNLVVKEFDNRVIARRFLEVYQRLKA